MSEGLKRRDFLKVLGASGAGAAAVGCSTGEVERLIPYVIPSDDIVPGTPTWYNSTCRDCKAGCGIMVETHEGRVTKLEGNPDHPISHGSLCARGQASVQGLYHPDRVRNPLFREVGVGDTQVTWGTAEARVAQRIREIQQAGGAGRVVFLTQQYAGTMDRLVDDFVAAAGARRVIHDPWAGQPRDVNFANARLLVSFGADFLETWGSPLDYTRQFTQMRSFRDGQRGKFVWVGPHRPLTGLNADQWIAPRPGTEHILALALGGQVDPATAARDTEVPQAVIEQLVTEFRAANGVAIGPGAAITSGDTSQLRAAIDALGGTTPDAAGTAQDVVDLVAQMRAGAVDMILIDAPNPVYTLPASLGFADALRQVRDRVSFSSFPDDTSALCTILLPDHHFLESWGDVISGAGLNNLVQPAMRPVFNTKQVGDVLLSVARELGTDIGGGATAYYDYLRASWTDISGGGDGWREAVRRGGVYANVAGADAGSIAPSPIDAGDGEVDGPVQQATTPALPAVVAAPVQVDGDPSAAIAIDGAALNLVVYPSYRFYDGRGANLPWLLELPDPVTKVPWDSCVEIHPRTARELGIEQADVVEVTSPYGSVQTFAYIYPGVRPDVVAIQTGLGHDGYGRWTEGVGVNPNVLLPPTVDPASGGMASYGVQVSVSKVRGPLKNLPWEAGAGLFEQGSRLQHDRQLAQAISLEELMRLGTEEGSVEAEERIRLLRGYGGFAPVEVSTAPQDYPPPETHYGEYVEGATRWAMVIDLDSCIGCGACVTACQAENNIPVVGSKEVKRGRDLQWIRIERYFGVGKDAEEAYNGTATDDVRFLPMLCQHCGNAPCEPVCPVYAAYHTPDGLNGQVYNRCVGTRYCANNCPYKVRVFNWWTYEFQEPLNWQLNPDVTVRDKGVMEKCTFCVQRIREKEHVAARENRSVRDGEVVPACMQTCPTDGIVFGNIQDPESRVAQAARSQRGYRVLEELNTQPAIVYLKKVTLHEPAQGGHHAAEAVGSAGAEAH